ncbi:MAG: DUF4136 domain-containing protein [Rubrivivax sp.]|nr:DUF4136 domain-containing protein [Rubrivivax sp.]
MTRRPLLISSARTALAALALPALLAGCAGLDTVTSDVSSFGEWPTGRAPGHYAFERLPSQQADPEQAARLERAAAPALAKAGFVPVAAGQEPDVLVQLGARAARVANPVWDDPLWFRGGFGRYHRGPWIGPSWGLGWTFSPPRYEQETALLLRDRSSGKPLYETRAASDGSSRADEATLAAMFSAALADFPRPALSPRRVSVPRPATAP